MAYEIVIKKRFINKLIKLLAYLENEWSKQVAEELLEKLEERFIILSRQPAIGIPSQKVDGIRGIHISRHNKMYYTVSDKKIVILNLYDTRANPEKNPY